MSATGSVRRCVVSVRQSSVPRDDAKKPQRESLDGRRNEPRPSRLVRGEGVEGKGLGAEPWITVRAAMMFRYGLQRDRLVPDRRPDSTILFHVVRHECLFGPSAFDNGVFVSVQQRRRSVVGGGWGEGKQNFSFRISRRCDLHERVSTRFIYRIQNNVNWSRFSTIFKNRFSCIV